MQLGNNIFVKIKVVGSDKSGFLSYDNVENFTFVETAGTSLPYICFSFFHVKKELTELFIENNKMEVSIGETEESAETFLVTIYQAIKDVDKSGATSKVAVGGFIGDKAYVVDKSVCKSYPGNSLMVLKQVLESYPNLNKEIISDFDKVNEQQVIWRQTYETSASFLIKVILHMDVRPSFPLFTFDKYGQFYIRNFKTMVQNGPVCRFVPRGAAKESDEIQYINNLNIDNFKPSYNLYSGYNKLTEIYGVELGMSSYTITDNIPLLASTEEAEKDPSGSRVSLNKIQSKNVHKTYNKSYAYNTNKLVSLSSMLGVIELIGYYPNLKPTDLVYVETIKEEGMISSVEGYYLIDSIMVSPNITNGVVHTYVYITRDNNNNVEDFIADKSSKSLFKIGKEFLEDLLNSVAQTRTALATCSQIMDGTFTSRCLAFLAESKNGLLRMFSIAGTTLDFTERARWLQSMLCVSNTLMNVLLNMLFPSAIADLFRDFLIDKPSARGLLSKYIDMYVPYAVQSLIYSLVDSLCSVHDSLNSIAEDNGITARKIPEVPKDDSTYNEEEDLISGIITDFENNTTGLDIPFPVISLTESQKLMTENDLRTFIAEETINNLTDLGYMTGVDTDEFEDILLGKTPIDFNIINQINTNAGNSYNYRFWGTYGPTNEALFAWKHGDELIYTKSEEITEYTRLYNQNYSPYMGENFKVIKGTDGKYKVIYVVGELAEDAERANAEDIISNALAQLTDYYINKGYKDRYRTIPCTKLISATKNSRIYFACPQKELDIKFYINSKRIELDYFPIDLGYRDAHGNKILYNVFYTQSGYNSNSTVLEVRQG